jgi:hypothetical protein
MTGLQLQAARLWAPVVGRWSTGRRALALALLAGVAGSALVGLVDQAWRRCARRPTRPGGTAWWARRAAAGSRRGGGLDGAHGPGERLLGLGTGRGGRLGPLELLREPAAQRGGGQNPRSPETGGHEGESELGAGRAGCAADTSGGALRWERWPWSRSG